MNLSILYRALADSTNSAADVATSPTTANLDALRVSLRRALESVDHVAPGAPCTRNAQMRDQRAYSILHIKSISEDQRTISGWATTPSVDRVGDVIEPLGVRYATPLPLLLAHDSTKPVGLAYFDPPTSAGITFRASIARITDPGTLRDRVDEAWQSLKAGLIRGVSIGFRSLDYEMITGGGVRYKSSEVLELSLVAVPANQDATIAAVKAFDIGRIRKSGVVSVRKAGVVSIRDIGAINSRSADVVVSAKTGKRVPPKSGVFRLDSPKQATKVVSLNGESRWDKPGVVRIR